MRMSRLRAAGSAFLASRRAVCAVLAALCCAVACATTTLQQSPGPIVRTLLGAGDIVEVRIFGEPDLSGMYAVTEDGSLRLPLVGSLPVRGLTGEQLVGRIEEAYNKKYMRAAQATVAVKESNSRKVYVLGEVARPGPYPFEDHMTVISAIASAGGTTKAADSNRTIVTRQTSGLAERHTVEAGDMGRGITADVDLRPGDIVFVPEAMF